MERIFLHGLDGSSRGTKVKWFRRHFPDMLIPDFVGGLGERMADLNRLLAGKESLVLIGSSYGGLMAAIYALENGSRVDRVILLAPALNFSEFNAYKGRRTKAPARLYIGRRDTICPPEAVNPLALAAFANLVIHETDDDHLLTATFPALGWHELLAA